MEVRCDATERSGRHGVMRRVTLRGTARYQLHIIEEGDLYPDGRLRPAIRRHFVLDSCSLVGTDGSLGDRNLQIDAGDGVMVHMSDTVTRTPDVAGNQHVLPPDATLLLAGGSALVEAVLFHRATGPRPSNRAPNANVDNPDFNTPDGQDIFLGLPGPGRAGTHLTVIQCESQSWWFLGRHADAARSHNTVLIGVTSQNVNWQFVYGPGGDLLFASDERGLNFQAQRYLAWNVQEGLTVRYPLSALDLPENPPSVVWRGASGRCVFVGCRFGNSVVTDQPGSIVDVATTFRINTSGSLRKVFLFPRQIPTRPTYRSPSLVDAETLDGRVDHLVPILHDSEAAG